MLLNVHVTVFPLTTMLGVVCIALKLLLTAQTKNAVPRDELTVYEPLVVPVLKEPRTLVIRSVISSNTTPVVGCLTLRPYTATN